MCVPSLFPLSKGKDTGINTGPLKVPEPFEVQGPTSIDYCPAFELKSSRAGH